MADNSTDMKEVLAQVVRTNKTVARDDPEVWDNFLGFVKAGLGEGALSEKAKELISVALAVSEHCTFCIAMHVKCAIEAGATRQEIMETGYVAAVMGGGPSMAYLGYVIDACDQFGAE